MDKEMQYDSSLGGKHDLLPRINLLRFTSARAKEIEAMKKSLTSSTSTKLAFQRLPKHMRRRVMSHNAKRLPRRLREIHINQLKKSGMPPKQKRPSRKYRRRPRNLLADYSRRQRNLTWLETHIWHAKRFHMVQKWGYKLADRPCDKAFRACYRATSKHCLIQDLSYFNCVEISGAADSLQNGFKTICDCKVDLSIGAKSYIHGNREGQVVVFHNSSGIKKAIGTVYFHWKPELKSETASKRTLWMWIHAAYYLEVLQVLLECFNCESDEMDQVYKNKNSSVQLIELKDKLNRFRLTGPLSIALLNQVLKTLDTESLNLSKNCDWFKHYLANPENLDIFQKQSEYWKIISKQSSAELSPRTILSLMVVDPRFNLPKSKTKAILQWHAVPTGYIETPKNAALGPIWNDNIRTSVKDNKISNTKLAELRSGLLVPGSEIEQTEGIVPVMIIQRPGNRSTNCLGYNSGWDLIVPAGWGNTFWISLIMWGGRAGGLQAFSSLRFESGETPFLLPDTQAGKEEAQKIMETNKECFFNLPPNKRPNYIKYGTIDPFSFNWKLLIREWNSLPVDDFFVLRHKSILTKIQELLSKPNTEKCNIDYNMNCIVPVRIKLEQKGAVKQFARIYLAESNDLIVNQQPTEPLKEDKNQEIRKKLRHSHKNLLKQLRRKRVKAKQNGKIKPIDMDMLHKYREQMKKLWLPEQNQNIRGSCSRQVIGFVTSGDFSFTQAHSCGIGYITMGAIKALQLKPFKNKVLVRNIGSRQYRVGTLEIIV